MSASVNLPLHRKVQKFSSGTGSPGWSRKKGRKMAVMLWLWWLFYVVLSFGLLVNANFVCVSFSLSSTMPSIVWVERLCTMICGM